MTQVVLVAGDASVTVDPEGGGRLTSWRVGDLELLGGVGNARREHGCYVMAPWAGRLRDNTLTWDGESTPFAPTYDVWAIHGTVVDHSWRVLSQDGVSVRMACRLDSPWPWNGVVYLDWSVEGGALESRIEVSADDAPFPASVGWHPWFRRRLDWGGEAQWNLQATAVVERGVDGLPTGRRRSPREVSGPVDDAFAVPSGVAAIRWPEALSIRCESSVGWYVVYDERAPAVCVEPQSAPPDGVNRDPLVVRPGTPLVATARWSWQPEPPGQETPH